MDETLGTAAVIEKGVNDRKGRKRQAVLFAITGEEIRIALYSSQRTE